MSIYENIKQSVTVLEAAEYYGLTSKNRMVLCPFHDDKTPSLRLNRDYFYCFGCGASGDVIDLVANLFNFGSYEAAKKLVRDFGIDPDTPERGALKEPSRLMSAALRREEIYCRRVLDRYLYHLHIWKECLAPKPDEIPDERFIESCQMLEYIQYLADFFASASEELRIQAVKKLMADGKIHRLEQRLERIKEAENERSA